MFSVSFILLRSLKALARETHTKELKPMTSASLTIVGNATSDPELRYTQSGLAVANFTVASTPRRFDKVKNEWVDEETLFLVVTVWRDYAEHVAASIRKGHSVVATGTLRAESYETRPNDGTPPQKRTSFRLDADEVAVGLRYSTAVVTRAPRAGSALPDSWAPADVAPALVPA